MLTAEGYDCVHVGDLEMAAASDSEIIDTAIKRNAAVVTLDSDFAAIIAHRQATGPSLIHLRMQHLHVQAATDLLLRILPMVADDLAEGAVVAVTPRGVRIRRLPLPAPAPRADDAE